MQTVVLVIHLMVAFALVVVVLLQRSEGGALGMGAGTGGGLTTARGAANILTRVTAILAACFIITSLTLAILAGNSTDNKSILEKASAPTPAVEQPAEAKTEKVPTPAPATEEPEVPIR